MEALGVEQKDEASLGATIVFAEIKGWREKARNPTFHHMPTAGDPPVV